MNRRVLTVLLAIAGGIGTAFVSATMDGCGPKTVVTSAPTGVDPVGVANWYKATGAFAHIADLLQQAEGTMRTANQTKLPDGTVMLPDGEYYQQLLRGFGKIAITQRSAAEYLKTVPNSFGAPVQAKVGAYAKAIQGFVQDLTNTGVAGIKDPASQQIVGQLITEIGAAIQFALSFSTADYVVPVVQPATVLYADVRQTEVCFG